MLSKLWFVKRRPLSELDTNAGYRADLFFPTTLPIHSHLTSRGDRGAVPPLVLWATPPPHLGQVDPASPLSPSERFVIIVVRGPQNHHLELYPRKCLACGDIDSFDHLRVNCNVCYRSDSSSQLNNLQLYTFDRIKNMSVGGPNLTQCYSKFQS